MRLVFSYILFLVATFASFSQNSPKDKLEKVSDIYSSNTGYELSFTLNTKDTKSKVTYTHDGKAYIKGNKFKIDVPDGTTWFDGKTQWVYMKGGDEVNVSNPSGEELAAISPVALLSMYKKGFKLNDKGTREENGKSVFVIEMVPQKKGGEITKITVSIDKSTNYFSSIVLEGKDKVNNQLIIKKHEKGNNLSDSMFVFNESEYPNLEVIDLR